MAGELAALETVLMRLVPDPQGFARRAFEQLLERLAIDPAAQPHTAGAPVPGRSRGPDGDHNVVLAAALGACECWGTHAECPICSGQGVAGWVDPDPELYALYVAPAAVRARAAPGTAPPPRRTEV